MADISVFEAIDTQRAIRGFASDSVPDHAIARIIAAATLGPSGGNRQPWSFIVIREPETKRRMEKIFHQEALEAHTDPTDAEYASQPAIEAGEELMLSLTEVPVLIMACVYPKADQDRAPAGCISHHAAGAIYPAIQNLMLEARGLGLGTCVTTRFLRHEAEFKTLLGIPDEIDPKALIPMGYPGEGQHFGGSRRKPVEEVTFYERWGRR